MIPRCTILFVCVPFSGPSRTGMATRANEPRDISFANLASFTCCLRVFLRCLPVLETQRKRWTGLACAHLRCVCAGGCGCCVRACAGVGRGESPFGWRPAAKSAACEACGTGFGRANERAAVRLGVIAVCRARLRVWHTSRQPNATASAYRLPPRLHDPPDWTRW